MAQDPNAEFDPSASENVAEAQAYVPPVATSAIPVTPPPTIEAPAPAPAPSAAPESDTFATSAPESPAPTPSVRVEQPAPPIRVAPAPDISQAGDPAEQNIPEPVIAHRRYSDDRLEAQQQARDQSLAQREQRTAQAEERKRATTAQKILKQQGVELELGQDGNPRPRVDAQGRALFKPKIISPFEQNEKGVFSRRRNRYGEEELVPLNPKIDPATGEKYVIGEDGKSRVSLGIDEGFVTKKQATVSGQQASVAKGQLAEIKRQEKAVRDRIEAATTEAAMLSTKKELSNDERIRLAQIQKDNVRDGAELTKLGGQKSPFEEAARTATAAHLQARSAVLAHEAKRWGLKEPGAAQEVEKIVAAETPDVALPVIKDAAKAASAGVTTGAKLYNALGALVRGIADVPASVMDTAGILAIKLDRALPAWTREIPGFGGYASQGVFSPKETFAGQVAGGLRNIAEGMFPENKALQDDFVFNKVPQGLGSALGFMSGGLLSKSKYIVPAALGAGVGFAGGYDDAIQHGASDDDAFKAALLNGGVGLSEVVPIGGMLNRWEHATGGTFKKAFVNFIRNGAFESVEEAAQEFFQTTMGNKFARDIYDKDRALFEGAGEGAAVGGVSGFLLSTIVSAATGGKLKLRERSDNKRTVEAFNEENQGREGFVPLAPKDAPILKAAFTAAYPETMGKEWTAIGDEMIRLSAAIGDGQATPEQAAALTALESRHDAITAQIQANNETALGAVAEVQQAEPAMKRKLVGMLQGTPTSEDIDSIRQTAPKVAAVLDFKTNPTAQNDQSGRPVQNENKTVPAGQKGKEGAQDANAQPADAGSQVLADIQTVVPAIRVRGQVIEGRKNDTHQDILNRYLAENPDDADALAEFDTPENPNLFRAGGKDITRDELQSTYGIRDSQQLRKKQAAEAKKKAAAGKAGTSATGTSGGTPAATAQPPVPDPKKQGETPTTAGDPPTAASNRPPSPTPETTPSPEQQPTPPNPATPGAAGGTPPAAPASSATTGTPPTEAAPGTAGQTTPAGEGQGASASKPDSEKRSSTQVNLPEDAANALRKFGQTIDPADLYHGEEGTDSYGPEYGLETEPHITALYGLTGQDAEEVRRVVADFGPITATLGKVTLFENDGSPYDVVKFDIDSHDLHRLNAKLKELPFTSDFPDYTPHATIAYVKKGTGQKYVGAKTGLTGRTITFDTLKFSNADRVKTDISLTAKQPATAPQGESRARALVAKSLKANRNKAVLDALQVSIDTASTLPASFRASYTTDNGAPKFILSINLSRLTTKIEGLSDEKAEEFIETAIGEEIKHFGQFEAVRRAWQDRGRKSIEGFPASFADAFRTEYGGVEAAMNITQRKAAFTAYTGRDLDDKKADSGDYSYEEDGKTVRIEKEALGAEFVRQLIQKGTGGQITEATIRAKPIIDRLLAVLKELLDRISIQNAPKALQRAYDQTKAVLAEIEAGQKPSSTPSPETGGTGAAPSAITGETPAAPAKGELPVPESGIGSVYEGTHRGQKVWMVQNRAERGFGDSIHETKEEAIRDGGITARQAKDRAEGLEKLKKDEDAAAAKKAEAERLDGFTDSMTPMQRGKIAKILAEMRSFRGEALSRRDIIRKLVAEGRKIEDSDEGRRLINENDEFLSETVLTKAGMDYAAFLISKKPSAEIPRKPEAEKPAAKPPAKKAAPKIDAAADKALDDAFEGLESAEPTPARYRIKLKYDLVQLNRRRKQVLKQLEEFDVKITKEEAAAMGAPELAGQIPWVETPVRDELQTINGKIGEIERSLGVDSSAIGLESAEPITQAELPPDKIGAFVNAAQKLIASGITTPEGMAAVLDEKFQGRFRKYSEALWDAFGMANKSLRGTHDWTAIYEGLDNAKNEGDTQADDLRPNAENAGERASSETDGAPTPEGTGAVSGSAVSPEELAGGGTGADSAGQPGGGTVRAGLGDNSAGGGNEVERADEGAAGSDDRATDDARPGASQPGGVSPSGSSDGRPGAGDSAPLSEADKNHVIGPDDVMAPNGNSAKLRANIAAIKLLKKLEKENRNPTPDEKKRLVQYTGWGQFKGAFDSLRASRRGTWQEDTQWEKNWGESYDQIKKILTDEEWNTAAGSTSNAHYTARPEIVAMWDMAKRLGFNGGRIGEWAIGAGHFFGLMPPDIAANSNLFGVDLDSISARLSAKLYPQADIKESAFEKAKLPTNYFDLQISNVPFLEVGPGDSRYPKLNLHNYYFARSFDLAKPGGLIIYITSNSTLDNNPEQRAYLQSKADLVAAIRLPNDAFKSNAGTEVTTDILIFRKPDGTPFQGEKFTNITEVAKVGDKPVMANEYFKRHPEMALGKHTLAGTQYRADQYALVSDKAWPIETALKEAIETLPTNIANYSETFYADQDFGLVRDGEKEGSVVFREGLPLQVLDSKYVTPEWAKAGFKSRIRDPKQRIRAAESFVNLRDTMKSLLAMELSPASKDEEIEQKRVELRDAYRKHVKTFNQLEKGSLRFLEEDPEYYLVMALEIIGKERNGDTFVKTVSEADILTRRTLFPSIPPNKADDVKDAARISLQYRGKIDTDYVAELTGHTAEDAERELIASGMAFKNPATGLLEVRDTYLSSNVRRKLAEAEAAAQDDQQYIANVEALRAIQPERVGFENIRARAGSAWVPESVYTAFAQKILGESAKVTYAKALDRWSVTLGGEHIRNAENTSTYGTERLTAVDILDDILNLKNPTVRDQEEYFTDAGNKATRLVVNKKETDKAREKATRIKSEFDTFMREDLDARQKIEDTYNDTFNSYVVPLFDGSHLVFPGMAKSYKGKIISLRPHQKDVIYRITQVGSAMMAHGVGGGKTIAQIAAAMEMRRLGLARKPLMVVDKPTIGQFAATFRQIYPNANVLVATEDSFSAANRKRFMSRIATGNWDAIIMANSQFDLMPSDPDTITAYIQTQIDNLRSIAAEAEKEDGKQSPKVRQIQTEIKRLEARLDSILSRLGKRQDNTIYFEQTGIDALFLDEAHAYKKVPFQTKMDPVKGIDRSPSQKAINLHPKIQFIQEKNRGRNVILATGTPVTNTLAEAWTMTRLVAPKLLEEFGVDTFDRFVSAFARTESKTEMDVAGNWTTVERLSKFSNGPELVKLIRTAWDVRMGEDLKGLSLPEMRGGKPQLIALELTPEVAQITTFLNAAYRQFNSLKANEKRENSWVPIVTMGTGMAAATDPRLIDTRLPDNPNSLVNTAVRKITDIYHETTAKRSTQIVFLDRFRPRSTAKLTAFAGGQIVDTSAVDEEETDSNFNLYDDMREKLVKAGVKREEIAIANENDTEAKRLKMQEDMNAGRIRILMGSTAKIGQGINVQDKLIAAHHLDPPLQMTPAQYIQRNGRIIRDGNENAEVDIFTYGVKRSMAAGIWDRIETKAKFIVQILMGKGVGRDFEDPADEITMSIAEQVAELTGDRRVLRKVELEAEVRDIQGMKEAHFNNIGSARSKLQSEKARVENLTRNLIPQAEKDKAWLEDHFGEGKPLAVKVGDQSFATVEDFDKRIKTAIDNAKKKGEAHFDVNKNAYWVDYSATAEINGMKTAITVTLTNPTKTSSGEMSVSVRTNFSTPNTSDINRSGAETGKGLIAAATTPYEERDARIADLQKSLENARENIVKLEAETKKTFTQGEELSAKESELSALIRDLSDGRSSLPPIDGGTIDIEPINSTQEIHELKNIASNADGSIGTVSPERQQAQAESIREWAGRNGKLATADAIRSAITGNYQLGGGEEHDVWLDESSGRIQKVTKHSGGWGNNGDLEYYLNGLARTNTEFGDDIRIEAVVEMDGWPHIVISQPFHKGEAATVLEIDAFFKERGYRKIAPLRYYNDQTKTTIWDAKPWNVLKLEDGTLMPFDVQFDERDLGYGLQSSEPDNSPAIPDSKNLLLSTFRKLPERERIVVTMRAKGEPDENIAAAAGMSVDAVERAFRTAKARLERARESISNLPAAFARTLAEPEGQRTIGRPDLANPPSGPMSRRFVDTIDEARGVPIKREDEQVIEEANARTDTDAKYKRERENLFQKAMTRPGDMSDTDVVVAKKIVTREAMRAIKARDQETMLEAAMLVDAYRITGTEMARAFRQRRDWTKSPAERLQEYVAQAILTPPKKMRERLDDTKDNKERERILRDWVRQMNRLKKQLKHLGLDLENMTDAEIQAWLSNKTRATRAVRAIQAAKADAWDALYEYWIASILSSPTTQVANLIGNFGNSAWDFTAQRLTEAMVNLAVGDPNSAQLGEFAPMMRAIMPGLQRASRNFLQAWRTETPVFEEEVTGDEGTTKLEEMGREPAIEGTRGRVIRTPLRLLLAVDEFSKSLIGQMQAAAVAYRISKEEGLSGAAQRSRIDALMAPGSVAWQEAVDKSKELAFQQEMGRLGKAVILARSGTPGLRYFVPFVTTIANIFKTAIRKTPLGSVALLYRMSRQGAVSLDWDGSGYRYTKKEFVPHAAEQLLAWSIFFALRALVEPDDEDEMPILTGTTPYQFSQRGARDLAYRTAPPMSIRIGGEWYSYSRIEPFATALGVMADGLNKLRETKNGKEHTAALGELMQHLTAQVKDKTFARGIGDILNALEDGASVTEWVGNFATSWVPNIIRATARETDDAVREQKLWGRGEEWGDRLKDRLIYKTLPIEKNAPEPKVDLWGREIQKDKHAPGTDLLWRMMFPARTQPGDTVQDVDRLIMRWNNENPNEKFAPQAPAPKWDKTVKQADGTKKEVQVYMSDKTYNRFLQMAGKGAAERLKSAGLNYENPTKADLEKIEDALAKSRKAARDVLWTEKVASALGNPLATKPGIQTPR